MKIGVIGAGTMGQGIAKAFAQVEGNTIALCDIKQEWAENGLAKIKKGYEKLVAKGKIPQEKADAIVAAITPGLKEDLCADCDLIVEAAFEDMKVKQTTFGELDKICKPECIFASNTSSLSITEIGKDYVVNEGDGAFYGPKLDFHLADSLGRTWQCGTIQLDSQLPERFELEYTGEDGQKHRPVMVHRVVLGSVERFIGVITEHFAGAFPVWLNPVQVKVLPITDRALEYADQIAKQLDAAGFRVEVDGRNEKIGKKIREATLEKIPYMLVVGDRDMENQTVSVRLRTGEDLGAMSVADFAARLKQDVDTKAIW